MDQKVAKLAAGSLEMKCFSSAGVFLAPRGLKAHFQFLSKKVILNIF
jgi:hypothetical protein